MRSKLAARGMIASGALFTESARLHGEQIRALAVALLETTMEGYELYGITIDDDMAKSISNQVMESVALMVKKAPAPAFPGSTPSGLETHYPRMVEQTSRVVVCLGQDRDRPEKAYGEKIRSQ